MGKDDLGYFRNEIFTRHRHTFNIPKMQGRFNMQEWYWPNVNDAATLLNNFEKQNVGFIRSKEGK